LTQNDQILQNNTRGEEHISRGQPCPHCKGQGNSTPQFWGFPSIYMYTLWRSSWNFVTALTLKKLDLCPYHMMERLTTCYSTGMSQTDGWTDLPQQYNGCAIKTECRQFDILVPTYSGCPGKCPLNECCCCRVLVGSFKKCSVCLSFIWIEGHWFRYFCGCIVMIERRAVLERKWNYFHHFNIICPSLVVFLAKWSIWHGTVHSGRWNKRT